MKKLIPVFLLLILVLAICVHAAPEKVKLELGCFPALDAAYGAWLPEYTKKNPNVEVTIKALGWGDHHNALVTAVAAGEGAPDVAAIDVGFIAQFVASGGMSNLLKSPFNAKRYQKNYAKYKWAQAMSDDGQLIALPVDIAPACAYYRRDVFEKAGIKIENVKTMDDLFAAAKKMTYDENGDGKNDHWFIADATNIAFMILRSDPDQQLYFDKKGNCIVDKERFKLAFSWAQKFRQAGLDAGIGAWTNEWYQAFQEGTIAYEPSGAWLGGHLKNWMAPKTAGKWGVALFPALKAGQKPMMAGWGGSFLAIPEQCKHKAEAWKLVQFGCTNINAQITAFKTADCFPAFKPAWKDPVFSEKLDFFAGQQARLLWIEIANAVPEQITNRFDNVANAIIGSELGSVLNEGKSVDQSLKDAKDQIMKRVKRG